MTAERVLFRKWKGRSGVIAFFPDQPDGPYLTSYEPIGQHGRASYPHPQTEPATPEDYAPLLAELRSIGYTDLKIVTRVTRVTR